MSHLEERVTEPQDPSPIKRCPDCGVHRQICVCDRCRRIEGAPKLWILQHPSEAGHSKGTLRVARACLPGLRVAVGEGQGGDDFGSLRDRLEPGKTALLFPHSGSRALEQIREAHTAVPEGPLPENWLLIDATWRKARRIYYTNCWLADFPGFHFATPPRSAYCIRKSSGDGKLSTVEAIHYLLSLVQPECDSQPLLDGFQALMESQLRQMPAEVRTRYG